ncbi:hypothetical protein COI68_27205 [Priestia megaterium]|uniref:hypothetical protein n=1 Tax=Priestia megaterium TaxID=1404 RepID=UPI000BF5D861|nr:hypothetical protein [Priestia megaterium]PFI59474.1 hypothetical protein COI68_27205 [Priestia megaterium]
MNVDKIVSERKRLEYIVDNCQFETAEQVCELFEAYTHLIWKYKQVGRIYDFYYDDMIIHREGGNDLIGIDKVVQDTLACLAAFPDMEFKFYGIHGVGNPEDGFRFGQAVHFAGTNTGISKYGRGDGSSLPPHECVDLCECLIKKVDGRWRVVEEWGTRSTETMDRVLRGLKSKQIEKITEKQPIEDNQLSSIDVEETEEVLVKG